MKKGLMILVVSVLLSLSCFAQSGTCVPAPGIVCPYPVVSGKGSLVQLPASATIVTTGTPVAFGNIRLHVAGQPILVDVFTVSLYPMNTPPPWPVGLWLDTYVETTSGASQQPDWCRYWIYKVASDELNAKSAPYPFFEMNLPASGDQIQTDEGIPVYTHGSVGCYEVENSYGPA